VNRPNPPPALPKDKEPSDVFQRWLYNFWEYVVNGNIEDMNLLLAGRVFDRQVPFMPLTDTSKILEMKSFTRDRVSSDTGFSDTTKFWRGDRTWSNTLSGDFTVNGNVTLGDTAADALTINAGTLTYGANYSASRNAGAVATGVVNVLQESIDFSGDSGGVSSVRPWVFTATPAGGNNFVETRVLTFNANNNSTGVTALTQACSGTINILSTGNTTSAIAFSSAYILSSSGNITTAQGFFAAIPTFLSTGAITTLVGYSAANLGNAKVATAVAYRAVDMSGATVGMRAFQAELSSGSGKLNFYASGTADNIFTGNVRVGAGTVPTVALDVTGSAAISNNLTLPAAPSDPILLSQIFGG
jgi:hypothetical protein